MAAALSRALTLPVTKIITSFMEFAPGVPDTDELLKTMMLQIRKKCVDNRGECVTREASFPSETCVKVGEKYMFKFEVRKTMDPNEDEDEDEDHMDYSLADKEIHGWLVKKHEGPLGKYPCSHWYGVEEVVWHPATPYFFRELRSELLSSLERAERDGLCPKAPGRRFCERDMQTVRFLRVPGCQYCIHCCMHLAFHGSDVP